MDPTFRSPRQQVADLPMFTGDIATMDAVKLPGEDWKPRSEVRAPIAHHHSEGPSQALKQRLAELAEELLLRAGTHGVGFDEVRMAAETRGWLTGAEMGRWLSCGDAIMKHARGKGGTVDRYRPSLHRNAHRRRVAVHVHERFVESDPSDKR